MLSFAKLSRAGIPQAEALKLQAGMATPWLATRLADASSRVKNGSELGKAFIDGGYDFPDRIIADDISAFSGSANFPKLVEELSTEWLEDTENKLQGLLAMFSLFMNLLVNGIFLLAVVGMTQLQNVLTAAVH